VAPIIPSNQPQDCNDLQFEDASQDTTVVFLLLHEPPLEARLKTIAEAWRETRPGASVVFVDYHIFRRAVPKDLASAPALQKLMFA
jgi:hypothetical protein